MTGEDIIKVRDQLRAARSVMLQPWRECADIYMPYAIVDGQQVTVYTNADCHDSTGRQSAMIMANGLAVTICPREEEFFEYVPPEGLEKNEEAKVAYREATATAQSYLQSSNFWEEIGEAFVELPVFGTGSLYVGDLDDREELYFQNQTIGTYYIGEDAYRRVNCFYRDLQLTAEQAAQEFGEDSLTPEIRAKLSMPEGKTEKFNFVHGVGRHPSNWRPDPNAPESTKGEWYSITVDEKTKAVVQRKSFKEFPFAVCRYRRFGRCVWGFGPGVIVKGEARELSVMNDLASMAVETMCIPPIVAPSGLQDGVKRSAGEITYYDANDANSSQPVYELAGKADLNALQWLMERRTDQVEKAFHVDLFSLFTQRLGEGGTPPTATEVQQAVNEKLSQFSPVWGRIMSEMMDVILYRIFNVLLRAGKFGDIFQNLRDPANPSRVMIPRPSLLYKNRIVLAMQSGQTNAFMQSFSLLAPLVQFVPNLLDAFKIEDAAKGIARNLGVPEEWIRVERELRKFQEARAAQAAQAQAMQQAEQASVVAKNLGGAPPQLQSVA